MAAINFPTSPINDEVFGMYKYNSTIGAWLVDSSPITTLGTVTTGIWNATTIGITYGGTGATTVAGARTNLGLAGLSGDQTFTGLQIFNSALSSTIAVVVKGAASQTANLQEWQSSAGAVLSKINNSGSFVTSNGSYFSALGNVLAIANSSSIVPAIIKGAASQTANLQEWQNSGGTILSRVDANGNIYAPSFTGTLVGSTTSVVATVPGTTSAELVRGNMADNDNFRILVGGTAANAGYAEIATADDGTEPIYVRQYTGTFTTLARSASLLDDSGNTSFPGVVTAGGFIANAGTASLAPIRLTSGTNLTTPAAGAIEFDSKAFYGTPAATSGRGTLSTAYHYSLGSNAAGTNVTTAQPVFPALANGLYVQAGTLYEFELYFQHNIGNATAKTITVTMGGTATFHQIASFPATSINGLFAGISITTSLFTQASVVATSPAFGIRGRFRVNAAGYINPTITYSVAPTSVSVIAGSYIKVTPIRPATDGTTALSVGAWS